MEDIESYLSGNRSNVIDVREYNQIYSEHFVKNENRTDKILSLCKHRNNTLILKYINFISNNIERCNTKHYTIDISNLNLWELNSGYSIIQLLIEGIPKFIEHCIINEIQKDSNNYYDIQLIDKCNFDLLQTLIDRNPFNPEGIFIMSMSTRNKFFNDLEIKYHDIFRKDYTQLITPMVNPDRLIYRYLNLFFINNFSFSIRNKILFIEFDFISANTNFNVRE